MMISSINELQRGDLVIYRCGRTNYVNKPYKYQMWYDNNFRHREFGRNDDIIEIKRYVKGRFFYKLKTIYKRGGNNV